MLYDTHAHLDSPDFGADLAEVLARARAAGVSRIITVGTDLESSRRAIQIAAQHADIYAVVGWHPSYASQAPDDIRPALRGLAKHPRVVALGETGLDYHRLPSHNPESAAVDDGDHKARQIELFRQHLEVAADVGLNCVIHQRDALEDTLATLQPFAARVRGVFHCFANDASVLRRILALNSLVSYTGILTFKNGQNIREALAATPMNRFMLETDCPFLAPMPYRGKRCEPAYVMETATIAAHVKGRSLEEIGAATCATAEAFFKDF